jgi:Dolichyl-phosphate-mannose-protein mannosyltransferase
MIVAATALVRFVVALRSPAPWIIPDELIYSELGRSFARSGHFEIRDVPIGAWSFGPLYPIVISPAYRLAGSASGAYAAVKGINSVLVALAAIPSYLLARRLLARGPALLAALLAVAVPSAVYASRIMTESLTYPLFLVAVLCMWRALEAPTIKRELAAVATIAAAALARPQMIALGGAFAAAVVALAALDVRRSRGRTGFSRGIRAYPVTAGAVVVAAVAATALRTASSSAASLHGFAAGRIDWAEAARLLVYHVANFDLYVGVVPLAAFVVLAGLVVADRGAPRSLVAFAVLTSATFLSLVLVAAIYLSAVSAPAAVSTHRVYDRYTFYAAPLFLIALLVWVRRGLPRPRRLAAVGALVALLLPATLPFADLLTGREWGTSSSNVALLPWAAARLFVGTHGLLVAAVLVFCGLLTLLFLRADPARPGAVLRIVALNLVTLALVAQHGDAVASRKALRMGTSDPGWIDRAVGPRADVVAIWSGAAARGTDGWYTIWENDLFNKSVGRIYGVRDLLPYDRPESRARVRGRALVDRHGRPLRAAYVLTDRRFPLAGRRVASDPATGMVLVEVDGRLRLTRAL